MHPLSNSHLQSSICRSSLMFRTINAHTQANFNCTIHSESNETENQQSTVTMKSRNFYHETSNKRKLLGCGFSCSPPPHQTTSALCSSLFALHYSLPYTNKGKWVCDSIRPEAHPLERTTVASSVISSVCVLEIMLSQVPISSPLSPVKSSFRFRFWNNGFSLSLSLSCFPFWKLVGGKK